MVDISTAVSHTFTVYRLANHSHIYIRTVEFNLYTHTLSSTQLNLVIGEKRSNALYLLSEDLLEWFCQN